MFLMLMVNFALVVCEIAQNDLVNFLAKKKYLKEEEITFNSDGSVSYNNNDRKEVFRASILDESKLIQIITFDSSSVENERHLKCETYDENGKRRSYMKYENGKKKEYTEWNEKAEQATLIVMFDKDENEIGREEITYHENGNPKSYMRYEKGKKKEYKKWNEKHQETLIIFFKEDGSEFKREEMEYFQDLKRRSYIKCENGLEEERIYDKNFKEILFVARLNNQITQRTSKIYDEKGRRKKIVIEKFDGVFVTEFTYLEGQRDERAKTIGKMIYYKNGEIIKIKYTEFYYAYRYDEECKMHNHWRDVVEVEIVQSLQMYI